MRRAGLAAAAVVFGLSGAVVRAQESATPFECFPSCSEVDGRMLSLAGANMLTLGGDFINVQIVADGGGFQLGIFDGDNGAGGAGAHWDRVPPAELGVTMLRFRLFADPDGDGTGTTEVGPAGGWLSNTVNPSSGAFFTSSVDGVQTGVMPDNGWFDVDMENVPAAAASPGSECPAGSYCYRLMVTLTDPQGSSESNFKVRTTGQISLRPLAFSFVGALRSFNDAAIIYPRFPDLSETTYDGTWSFLMRVSEPVSFLTVWGGDFDYGSWDCLEQDTNDLDTCANTDPDSVCVPNSNPAAQFNGQLVPTWADGTAANAEGVALGNVMACGPTTGAPNDDQDPELLVPIVPPCHTDGAGNPLHCFFSRFPAVSYTLETPVGSFLNDNPSGNQEWEQFRLDTDPGEPADFHVASLPAGDYVIRYTGLDLANLNALRMSARIIGVPSGSIGDRIWLDTLRPEEGGVLGEQDPGEAGVNGVTVRLYRDTDVDGVLNPAVDELLATQLTAGDGNYDFMGLGAGRYFVDVDESTLPAGLALTTGNEPYTGPGGPYSLAESENHDEADFGYTQGAVGDLVWSDNNADGLFQPEQGEIGIDGVTVQLTGYVDGDGLPETLTQTTDSLGFYLFGGLFLPGSYEVRVVGPNFSAGAPLEGAIQTFDLDGLLDDRTVVGLLPVFPGGFENLDADFGYQRPCAPCDGRITQMTLRYLGPAPAFVQVFMRKGGEVFAGSVEPLGYFTFDGTDRKGTLGPEIEVFVDGSLHTTFHTSCSVEIGPGTVQGDFLVAEAYSRNGGLMCPIP